MANKRYDVKVLCPVKGVRNLTLFHARCVDESEAAYKARYDDIVAYSAGSLSDIERIREVQMGLLCQGYGLSNTILLEVGPLYPMN